MMESLSLDRLRELFSYDPITGIFTKKIQRQGRGRKVGVNIITSYGYVQICIDRRAYFAHRLAWFYYYGDAPSGIIDHKNCEKTDNRIANLRIISHSGNNQNRFIANSNSSSGYLGVHWSKKFGKWMARITIDKKTVVLGFFDNQEDANRVYLKRKKEFHPLSIGTEAL